MANYKLSKGKRFKKGTIKTKKYGRVPIFNELYVDGHWYCTVNKLFTKSLYNCVEQSGIYAGTSMFGVHSVKAAKRIIRQHNEIPKGTKCYLISNFEEIPEVVFTK